MNSAAQTLSQTYSDRKTLTAGLFGHGHKKVLLLAVAIFFSCFFVVYIKDINRRLFVESQILTRDQNKFQTEYGQLLLEQSTWATQARIEKIATTKLNMQIPLQQKIVLVKTD